MDPTTSWSVTFVIVAIISTVALVIIAWALYHFWWKKRRNGNTQMIAHPSQRTNIEMAPTTGLRRAETQPTRPIGLTVQVPEISVRSPPPQGSSTISQDTAVTPWPGASDFASTGPGNPVIGVNTPPPPRSATARSPSMLLSPNPITPWPGKPDDGYPIPSPAVHKNSKIRDDPELGVQQRFPTLESFQRAYRANPKFSDWADKHGQHHDDQERTETDIIIGSDMGYTVKDDPVVLQARMEAVRKGKEERREGRPLRMSGGDRTPVNMGVSVVDFAPQGEPVNGNLRPPSFGETDLSFDPFADDVRRNRMASKRGR